MLDLWSEEAMNVEKYYLAAHHPDESEVEIWTLTKFLAEVEPGDGDTSWRTVFTWLNENHGDKLKELQNDIAERGLDKPILVGPDFRVWDGHHRLLVLYWLQYRWVPVELIPEELHVSTDTLEDIDSVVDNEKVKTHYKRCGAMDPDDWDACGNCKDCNGQ